MKREDPLFELDFLKRFSSRLEFLVLNGCFFVGLVAGAIAVKLLSLSQNQAVFPLFYSGIPSLGSGFISCFSTILLNILIALICIFLLGVTAFGAFGIPLFICYKGISAAFCVLFLLNGGGLTEFCRSALCYTPALTASSLLLIFFADRAVVFSKCLARAGFSQRQETLDFQLYFKDFLYFICFSVAVSAAGGLLSTIYKLL